MSKTLAYLSRCLCVSVVNLAVLSCIIQIRVVRANRRLPLLLCPAFSVRSVSSVLITDNWPLATARRLLPSLQGIMMDS